MKVQHAVGNAAAINALPVTPGKIYFAKDTKKIFFDTADGRIEINSDVVAQVANLLAAVTTLNGDANVAGSVANVANAAAAREVARIVGNADESLDTLEEIAAWISGEQDANIAGQVAVLRQDVDALQNANLGQRLKTLEDADFGTQINNINLTMATSGWVNTQLEAYAKLTKTTELETALNALADRVHALETAPEPQNSESQEPTKPTGE